MTVLVREYARITTDTSAAASLDSGVVSEATFNWLHGLASGWKGAEPVALINNRRSLKLGSYVGYLQSPCGESIEILPKTGMGSENPEEARSILQRMLRSALGIKPRQSGRAELMCMRMPLHEWIFWQFLQELKALVHRGLRFDYERVEEESRYIRGQLQLDKQQRQPPGKGHLFHICHDVFTPNRIENRLLKAALEWVKGLCKSPENWRLANELSHLMSDIPMESNPLQGFSQWRSSKLMHSYSAVRPWCELILEKLNPNFQKGGRQGISLLFPMEKLFEAYVDASLRKMMMAGAKLTSQASSEYLVRHYPDGVDISQRWFQLKPDFLLRYKGGVQVLDAKWKLLDQSAVQTDTKYGISQNDMYQLFAYGQKYQSGTGHMMLIYPKHEGFDQPLAPFYFSSDLVLWAVPFCLESSRLVLGEWLGYFPSLNSGEVDVYAKISNWDGIAGAEYR
ncbi:McrC family protein [Ketobacter sp.]|uniref:McrC family protein n=1 Tax=Ketobacter sp. TaxID=2083498 RepID=UPI000F18312E|nr:McrC family protein [Ketobacter sp.]RLU00190.1 MAG: restriction endonuclease [Ketobacter sp.]